MRRCLPSLEAYPAFSSRDKPPQHFQRVGAAFCSHSARSLGRRYFGFLGLSSDDIAAQTLGQLRTAIFATSIRNRERQFESIAEALASEPGDA